MLTRASEFLGQVETACCLDGEKGFFPKTAWKRNNKDKPAEQQIEQPKFA
jgi:hypothetical protein